MSAAIRPSSCPAQMPQASLLHGRGDLLGTRARFEVNLEKPSPTVQCKRKGHCIDRVGMDLKRDTSKQRLVVKHVDDHPRRRTPAAQWNLAEERQATRGDSEWHQNLAIKKGDRISAVNKISTDAAMFQELEQAMSHTSPKAVNLELSRDITEVLKPSTAPTTTRPSLPKIQSPPTRDTKLSTRPPRPVDVPRRSSLSGGDSAVRSTPLILARTPQISSDEDGCLDISGFKEAKYDHLRSMSKDSVASTRSPSVSGGSSRSQSTASAHSPHRPELLGASSKFIFERAGRSLFS
eukprot:gnl/TRDRNA2_/TRDRNA2_184690_c0_seq1.p1 gnl/TRDRNA2_/TRDRNA2_184690_c0~~gnl/TRDRNA2_/TRDRNA2_184690_c0_seq1.p1  ORF type:complete len:293 (+),score=38.31 gnl/TRDRNA2_/TRDRNA2_184690_c0_seq1:94-972(+)